MLTLLFILLHCIVFVVWNNNGMRSANAWTYYYSYNTILSKNNKCHSKRNGSIMITTNNSSSSKKRSESLLHGQHHDNDIPFFPKNKKKLAILTELSACDNEQRMEETIMSLKKAVSTGCVDLISIRVTKPTNSSSTTMEQQQQRIVTLAQTCMSFKKEHNQHLMVVMNDNIDAAIEAKVDGIHVKEKNVKDIPQIRQRFTTNLIIGTSAHTLESALSSWKLYQPDYFFVGTCYPTQSHPEKTILEGPQLPGIIRQAILHESSSNNNDNHQPIIYAIGGINQFNCWEPVAKYNADGIATIRAILHDPHPDKMTQLIHDTMNQIPK